MRIAIVAHHTAPIAPPFIGGVESHTWYLARWLARAGHEVTLYGLPGSHVPGVEVRPLIVDHVFSPAARRDVSALPGAFMAAHHGYLSVCQELAARDDLDVIHLNGLHYLPVAQHATFRAPTVLTLHCPPTPWLESALQTGSMSGRDDDLSITSVSPALSAAWSHVVADPSLVVNGVDFGAWRPGPGGTDAVWVGRIVPEKAPHLAVAAARRAGRAIRLAGPIVDRAYWDEHLRPTLGRDVTYEGHLDHAALGELVGGCAVAVHAPAWEEPFGLTAAEALACGTPVAAFARGGLPGIVGPSSGALAPPGDVDALARAIEVAAVADRAVVRADAEARLSIDAMAAGFVDVYRAAIAARRAPIARPALVGQAA